MRKAKLSDRAAEYIVSRKDRDLAVIGVVTIASALGVNPSYLSRKFNIDKDMTMNDFITGEKMRRSAIYLLKGKSVSPITLSKKTGFSRSDYFVTLFKYQFGIHPKQYGQMKNRRIKETESTI